MLPTQGLRWLLPLLILLLSLGGTHAAYGAGGDPIWQFADSQSGKQEAKASVVDSGGNVIITGYQNLTGVNDDYYTVKFKGNGSGVAWRATFDKAGGSDQPMAVVVDGNNDVIVTGLAWNGTDNDIHTVKYDGTTGAVLWQHSFNGESHHHDVGTSVTVDSLNNIYVAGYSQNESANDDYIILKYSPSGPDVNGDPLWKTILDGEAHGIDRISSIAVSGEVVAVTGRSWNGASFDMLTLKYDRSGTKLWEKRYSTGAGRYCSGSYVKIDSAGDVIATGSVANGIDLDIYTAKYGESAGALIWEQTYNGAYDDEPNALFIDDSDQVYVAGYTWTLASENDYYTVKYDGAGGTKQWQQLFNSSNGDTDVASATGLVVDPSGDVFVTGYNIGEYGGYDFHTVKYKKDNGNQLWEASNSTGPSERPIRPVGIGLSPTGEVLVARWVDTENHDLDYYVTKYDPGLLNSPTGLAGQASANTAIQLSWTDNSSNEDGFAIERCQNVGCSTFTQIATVGADVTTYNDTGLTANSYYSYRVRASSGAAGYSHYSDIATALTVMVNFGPPAWSYLYNGAANKDDFANAIAIGPDNNPVITGNSDSFPPGYSSGLTSFDYYTLKLNRADHSVLWSDRYNDPTDALDYPTCISVDSSNAVTVSGYATLYNGHSGDVNSLYTIRYPASGPPQLWAMQYNGPTATGATDDRAVAIASASDASGNVVVVGYGKNAAGNNDIYVVKYNGSGTQLWAATPFDGTGGDDFPNAVAIAPDGSVYVTGYTEKVPDTNIHSFYTAKYNGTTGAMIWSDVYSVTSTGDNIAKSLAIDAAGDLYITGFAVNAAGNRDLYTIKYNGTAVTAQRVWEHFFDGLAHGDDEAVAIRIDPVDGNLVVGGTSLSGTGNHDLTVIRYTRSGDVALNKTYQRPTNDDHARAMAVDSNGNIYLAADTSNGLYTDSLTVRFDYLGNISNAFIFNGAANSFDQSEAIVVNALDEAFVAGYTENAAGNADYLVYKIDPDTSQPFMPYAVAASSSYVTATLTWSDKSVVKDGYRIERKVGACSESNINPWGEPVTLPVSPNSYTDTGLNSGSSYCYRLQTFQNSGAATRWAEKTVTTPALPAPSNLAVPSFNSTQVNLSWGDTTTGETGFEIERCSGTNCSNFTSLATTAANATTSSDITACSGTLYRYRIMASGIGWDSPYSAIVTATTTTPGTPVLTATRASEVQINLSWTDNNADESGFTVERCLGAGCSNFVQIASRPANSTSYNDTGLAPNSSYSYRVIAFKTADCGWTRPSTPAVNILTTIMEPNNPTATANSTTQITVGWSDRTASETGFKVERCTGTGCSDFSEIGTAAANAVSFVDTNIIQGTTYRYRVRATNNTLPWDSLYTTPVERLAPAAATPVLTATRASEVQINLTWTDANTDETGFKVERCAGSGCSDFAQIGSNLNANTFSYNDTTGLAPNSTYSYRVSSFKTATNSWTMTSTVKEATTTLLEPNNFVCTPVSTTQVNCSWADRTASETGFKIERCTGTGCSDFAPLFTTAANATSYNDTSVCNGMTYSYRILAFNGSVPWSSNYSSAAPAITPAPSTPVLSVASPSETQSNLSWSDATADETGYRVERCSGVDCTNFTQIGSNLSANTFSYNDTGLTPGTSYTYRVKGYKTASCAWETVSNAVTKVPTVAGPTGLSVTTVSTTQINLAWTDTTSSETGFKIERCDTAGCSSYVQIGTAAANATTYNDTSVCSGNSYSYRVRATKSTAPAWDSDYTNMAAGITPAFDNLLADSGFENSTSGWPTAVGTLTGTSFDTGTQFNGAKSLKLAATGAQLGRSQSVTVIAGRQYTLSGQLNAALTAGTVQCDVYGTGIDSPGIAIASGDANNNAGWVSLSEAVTIPAGTSTVAVRCFANTASQGTAYFDAVSLAPANFILNATRVSDVQINLSWPDSVTDETGYKIERCAGAGCTNFVQITTTAANATSYNNSGLTGNTTYRYQVKGYKTSSCAWDSSYSTVAEAVTVALAPSGLAATTASTTQINLAWTDNTLSESGFRVERCSGAECSDFAELTPLAAANATSYADTSVAVGTAYRYRVRATNTTAGWNSGYSNEASASTSATAAPVLTATAVSDVRINLSWTDPTTDETGYKVERCTGVDCTNFTQIGGNLAANTTTYSDLALTPSTTYVYRVIGFKTATSGWTTTSNSATATTTVLGPINLGVTIVDTTTTRLAWTNQSTTETAISIERCPGTGCSDFAVIATIGAGLATYNDTTPCNNQPYSYRVRAINTVVPWTTDYTNTASVTIPVPVAPTLLTATRVNETQINLTWTDNTTDETGYKIERCEGAGCSNFTQLATVLANIKTYNHTGLTPNTTYRYQVRAYKTPSGGCAWDSGYSNISEAVTTIAAPSGLTATTPNSTQMNLVWANNTVSETGYKIARCAGADCSDFAQITDLTGKTTSWTDNTVAAGTTYRYRILATNTTIPWDSGYSNIAAGNTYPQDPPVLAATATAIKVTLTWLDRTVDETGFKIERCTGNGCADFSQIALAAANATTYIDTTVCNGITYNYRARATKSTERTYDTLYSNTVPITTSAGTIALTATRGSEVQINLSWTDPTPDEDGYRVERCVGSGCSDFTQMAALAKNSVSWSDTGLLPGYTYTYRVKNFNTTASCPWETTSNVASAVTSIPAPGSFTAVSAGMTQINLAWSDTTTTETGFRIERCIGASCSNFAEIALLTGSGTSWSDQSVVANTTYRYRVRATKTTPYAWDSEYSAIATATTDSTPAPPTGLSTQGISSSQINLSWNDAASGATGYRIESCSGTGCSSYSEIATVAATPKSYSHTGLASSTNYCYRIRGFKTGTPSWTTDYSSVSCGTTEIDAPTSLTAAPLNSSTVNLTWSVSPGANGYNIEEQIWNGEWVTLSTVGANETTFIDTVGKAPLKQYTYRIKAFNGSSSSSYSNQATATTPAFTTEDPTCTLPSQGPVISSTPVTTASEGTAYSYAVVAAAQGGRTPLTYQLPRKPEGMTIASDGLITWTPSFNQGGEQNVTVRVADSAGYSSDQNYAISVEIVNSAPSFSSTAPATAAENHPYSYQAAATDPENDPLTFSLVAPSPSGMTITAGGLVSWIPSPAQAGDNTVTIRVTDGDLFADQHFTVTVGPNHAPTFTSTPVTTALEGGVYSYQVTGTDLDGDPLSYTLTTAPSGMSISTGRLITWTPTLAQAQLGANPVTIQVSDGYLTTNQSFIVTVSQNHPPVIPTTPITAAAENSLYSYAVAATDEDNDTLTYTLSGAPSGMTISTAGVITWTPDYNQAGLPSPAVTVRASDPFGRYAEKSFTITVANTNRPPVISSTAITTGTAGSLYTYQVVATDPDGTAISSYALTTNPAGMIISGAGLITWTPAVDQATNAVTVSVSDGSLAATQSFNIDVQGPPAVPTLIPQGNFTSDCGYPTVTLSWNPVSGPRGHAVQYAVQVNGGAWSAWQSGTSFALQVSPITSYTWLVKARDGVTLLESAASSANAFGDNTTYCCSGCECDNSCGSSSCPLVYSYDGSAYHYETDLQGPAISQIKKGARNVTLYQPSYIVLENGLVPDANHQYRVKIWESLQEASLVDEATLLAVDYPEGYQIVSSGAENTYYYNYVDPFKIYSIKDPVLPISAIDKNGNDILAQALYVDNTPAPMATNDPDNYYTLDFGTIQHPEYAKLVIDAWQDINSKIYLSTITIQPYIEVKDAGGAWVKVRSFGMPAGDLKTMVIDLSGLFQSSDHRIRLHLGIKKAQIWVFDRIRLDDSAPVNVTIQQLQATAADLQLGGHAIQSMTSPTSRIIAGDTVLPIQPAFYGYGNFTRYGDVSPLVTQRDDKYVLMNYADKLELKFPEPLPPLPGMQRGFVLKVDNYYKEFKEYKYLEPLPFHGMSDYPYPATESYPTDADHNQYRLEYNTRVVAP